MFSNQFFMKIISYNVNGVRAAINKGLIDWLAVSNPDVLCLQEIKAQEDQVDKARFEHLGYAYQYWFPAQKKGYSGVAVLSKVAPKNVQFGTGIATMDQEGRNLRVDFDGFSLMSMYLPSGTNDDRLGFKFKYMDDFQRYIDELKLSVPKLVICGDYNICHEPIDIHDPVRLKTVSGFLPEERKWLSGFIHSGFVDSFRYLHPDVRQYSWWSYRQNARENNKGWRLDYFLVTDNLKEKIKRSVILSEATHSDHCPVLLELD